jgi:hypothetical protein
MARNEIYGKMRRERYKKNAKKRSIGSRRSNKQETKEKTPQSLKRERRYVPHDNASD